ncbi:restriction endonuclease [Moritella sp. 28]|uniref:nSTAND3 domain-containing NTPase n=1 Tax=Moritella sp. 28 TaxID=2746232 RepID=UPI001BA54DF0|nr:restriction endonuclease [Moritella sp. 28]QUM84589.1 restriction endonuclease [Moritella sp. 28]
MPDYNFEALHDKEFEELANDIISKSENVKVERFKPGKDGGVDGRFFESSGNEIIIQSKHYLKSGYTKLLRHCQNVEAAKVEKLSPSRYIFVCSEPLSRKQKSELASVFSPYLTERDVYGKEELNDYIKMYPDIERNHYKLWLTSTNTLQILLNQSTYLDSEWGLEKIKKCSKYYAKTSNHDEARKLLEKVHSVIISGEPGAGKTTLAEQLCLEYVLDGFELVVIEDDIKDAKNVFNKMSKQIFYFDDFLGSNYLEGIENKEDSKIMNFIEAIKNDNDKRFILTSRSSILNQGKNISAIFKNKKIEQREYVLDVTKLEDIDKARILYNHIYFSSLNEAYVEQLYIDKRYLKIIEHKNFNPRLIEFITDEQRFELISVAEYWNKVEESINNPKDIWEHVFHNQLKEYERILIFIIVYFGSNIDEETLKVIAKKHFKSKGVFTTNIQFDKAIKTLSGSLITRIVGGESIEFDLFNPSIKDYVISICKDDIDLIAELLFEMNSIKAYKSYNFSYLFSFLSNIPSPDKRVKLKLLDKISEADSFLSHFNLFVVVFDDAVLYDINDDTKSKCISALVDAVTTNTLSEKVGRETISLLKYLVELGDLTVDSLNWVKLIHDVIDIYPSNETLKEVTELLYELNEHHDLDCNNVIILAQESTWEHCVDDIHDFVSERVSDFESVDDDASKLADEMIKEYKIELNFTAKELLEHVDFDVIRQELRNDYEDDADDGEATSPALIEFNEIDDLFERT